jgi:hypothetical protein
LIWWDNLV